MAVAGAGAGAGAEVSVAPAVSTVSVLGTCVLGLSFICAGEVAVLWIVAGVLVAS